LLWAVAFRVSNFSQMILRRLGNKQAIAQDIIKYFPEHKIYVEPFFGAGGMFFNKPKADVNILNDLDSDVFNLFQVVLNNKNDLKTLFLSMPYHSDLMEYWKKNKENDPIKKSIRFLFLSNFSYLGKQDMLCLSSTKKTQYYYDFEYNLDKTYNKIFACQFANYDFRKFIKSIEFQTDGRNNEAKTFIYADPPYLNQTSTYSDNGWNENDCSDLFDSLIESKCKFAYSEFDHPFILEQAKQRNLNVTIIGERQNLKNRRTEILITNYEKQKGLFD